MAASMVSVVPGTFLRTVLHLPESVIPHRPQAHMDLAIRTAIPTLPTFTLMASGLDTEPAVTTFTTTWIIPGRTVTLPAALAVVTYGTSAAAVPDASGL